MEAPLYLDHHEVMTALEPGEAIEALAELFRAKQLPETPHRSVLDLGEGRKLLLMPSSGDEGVGVKAITLAPSNPESGLPLINGVFTLYEPDTLRPRLLLDGGALTALRTGAVSGLATRILARPEAKRLVVFGTGVQARIHIVMMAAVRPIRRVTVVSRSGRGLDHTLETARQLGLEAVAGEATDVAEADLVCVCTTSDTPVFDGGLLRPGSHVNAVGAYRPESRELDDLAVSGARLFVEDRDAALHEAGDLIIPIADGVIRASDIEGDFHQLVSGAVAGWRQGQRSVFKAVGAAYEDLAIAVAIERQVRSSRPIRT